VHSGGDRRLRITRRAALGPLRNLLISTRTANRYDAALTRFRQWLTANRLDPLTFADLDECLCDFVEELWLEGEPKGYAADALSGLQHQSPRLKGELRAAWRLYGAWCKVEVPTRAAPMSARVVRGLAGVCFAKGDFVFGVLVLVAFHGLLRTGELLQLRAADFRYSPDGTTIVLFLGYTKSGTRRGETEEVILDDPALCRLCKKYVPTSAGTLLPSGPEFRQVFAERLRTLGVGSHGYKPYSLRRGGATHQYEQVRNLHVLCTRGRWASQSTARLYVSEAAAELTRFELQGAMGRKVDGWAAHVR